MKTATIYKSKTTTMLPYPCAATKRETINNLLDKLIVGAIGAGTAASLLFIIALL